MAKFSTSVSHRLTQEEAIKRIKTLLGEGQSADKISNLREEWDGSTCKFSFLAMGLFSVSGTLTVNLSEVKVSGDASALIKGKIESTIRERAEILLA